MPDDGKQLKAKPSGLECLMRSLPRRGVGLDPFGDTSVQKFKRSPRFNFIVLWHGVSEFQTNLSCTILGDFKILSFPMLDTVLMFV